MENKWRFAIGSLAIPTIVGGALLLDAHPCWAYALLAFAFVSIIWGVWPLIFGRKRPKINNRLKDKARQERMKFRQGQIEKKQLPEKLAELDAYLAQRIKKQNLTAKTIISIGKNWLKWYDIPAFLFAGITYALPITRKIFIKMHVNFVIRFATRMNILLRGYKLGTLPIVETDETYNAIHEQILKLEDGLPLHITVKINRFISLAILLNCLRILSPERKYWRHLEAKLVKAQKHKWVEQFQYTRNSLSILLLPLDNTMTGLRAEISEDIEGYFLGD